MDIDKPLKFLEQLAEDVEFGTPAKDQIYITPEDFRKLAKECLLDFAKSVLDAVEPEERYRIKGSIPRTYDNRLGSHTYTLQEDPDGPDAWNECREYFLTKKAKLLNN